MEENTKTLEPLKQGNTMKLSEKYRELEKYCKVVFEKINVVCPNVESFLQGFSEYQAGNMEEVSWADECKAMERKLESWEQWRNPFPMHLDPYEAPGPHFRGGMVAPDAVLIGEVDRNIIGETAPDGYNPKFDVISASVGCLWVALDVAISMFGCILDNTRPGQDAPDRKRAAYEGNYFSEHLRKIRLEAAIWAFICEHYANAYSVPGNTTENKEEITILLRAILADTGEMKRGQRVVLEDMGEMKRGQEAAFNRARIALDEAQGDHAELAAAEFDLGRELEQVNPKWAEAYALMNHNPLVTESEMASLLGISQPSVHSRLEKLRKWLAKHHPGMTLPGDHIRRKKQASPRPKNLQLKDSDSPTIPDPNHGGKEQAPFSRRKPRTD